jgi:hypothetical protein
MITSQRVLDYVKAEPFRPFRIHLASGRTFDIRHPEMIKVLKNYILIFRSTSATPDIPDEAETVSLMLTESISDIENPVH